MRSYDQTASMLNNKLALLKGNFVQVSQTHAEQKEDEEASVTIVFSNGTKLRADNYWRIIKNGRVLWSSFDHKKRYGLPAPIDAIEVLKNELQNRTIVSACHLYETGDLLFELTDNVKLQVLNLTGYEVWEINFTDGTGAYSNYAK